MFLLYAEKNQQSVWEKEPVTSGSVNVYTVRFAFSPDWDGMTRTAIFQAGRKKKSVPLVDGVCSVPAEVLSEPGCCLMAGVCGEGEESAVLPTVWANLGLILKGAVTGGTSEPTPPPEGWQEELDEILAGKQNIITAGDGLTKDGDTLSVDNPVRGVLTQAEWDALTEEQKASGTWFVDDGTACAGGEVYDDQERVVGTWFGKPLYRKGFQTTSGSGPGQHEIIRAFLDSSYTVKLIQGSLIDLSGAIIPQGYYAENDGHRFSLLYYMGSLYCNIGGFNFYGCDVFGFVEYTKPTAVHSEEVGI